MRGAQVTAAGLGRSAGRARRLRRGLYAIADAGIVAARLLPALVAEILAGGASAVQYRDKNSPLCERHACAVALRNLCRRRQVPFLINDDVALALRVSADGVHLGHGDLSCTRARARLGATALIGISCYARLERAVQAQEAGADYVAFGSFYASPGKPGAARARPELLSIARQRLSIPLVAIGGITLKRAPGLLRHGADLVAVIRDLSLAPAVRRRARAYQALFEADEGLAEGIS